MRTDVVPIPRFYALREISEMLKISLSFLYAEVRRERLKAHRFGYNIRVSERDLQAYLRSREGRYERTA